MKTKRYVLNARTTEYGRAGSLLFISVTLQMFRDKLNAILSLARIAT